MNAKRSQLRAVRDYRRGKTTREIAAMLGVEMSTVRRMLAAAGVDRRRLGPRGRTDVATDVILELRDTDKLGWGEIAWQTGMSRSGVRARYRQAYGQPHWR